MPFHKKTRIMRQLVESLGSTVGDIARLDQEVNEALSG